MIKFKRGDVIYGNIPESQHTILTPKPGFFLHGKHMLVMLHDWDEELTLPTDESGGFLLQPLLHWLIPCGIATTYTVSTS